MPNFMPNVVEEDKHGKLYGLGLAGMIKSFETEEKALEYFRLILPDKLVESVMQIPIPLPVRKRG